MNRNSILLICILSVLSLSGLVLADEISIEFEVCSFRPEEKPTAKPYTVPDLPTEDVKTVPESQPPSTGSTNPEEATTTPEEATTTPEGEIGTHDEDETGESSAATTPADITTPAAETGSSSTPEDKTTTEGETGSTITPTVETTPTETKPTTSEAETPDGDSTPDGGDKTTPTTPETTTKTEATTTPTEADNSGTDDDGNDTTDANAANDGQELAKRGMDDDEEKLISHKRFLAASYYDWPKTYDDKMKEYVKEAFDGYVGTEKDHTTKVTKTEYDNSKNVTGIVQYNITIKVTYTNTEDKTYWDGIIDEIKSKNADKFYDSIKKSTGDDYSKCSAPDHLRNVTDCVYDKSLYLYTTSQTVTDNDYPKPIANPMTGYTINYTVSCPTNENDYLTVNTDGTGKVTVNTKAQKPYILCSVTCKVNNDVNEEYRNGYTSFTVKVTDENPTYSKIGSSIPKNVASTKRFTISMKLIYPTYNKNVSGVSMSISFQRNQNCSVPNTTYAELQANGFMSFKDLSIYCEPNDGTLVDVRYQISANNVNGFEFIDSIIKVKPAIAIVQRDESGNEKPPDYYLDLDYADNYKYVCSNGIQADVNGLCCEGRDVNKGESCTKSTMTFPFDVKGMSNEEWKRFAESYLDTIRLYVFHESNFFFNNTQIDISETGKIKINITFYEFYKWQYNTIGGNEISELVRILEEPAKVINWKSLSSPYDYINTIISYVNPAAVPEIQGETNSTIKDEEVLKTVPPELEAFLNNPDNSELKTKLVNAAEEVPQKVAETTTKVVEEINTEKIKKGENPISVSFDVEKGVEAEEQVVENAEPAANVIVTVEDGTTIPSFDIPQVDTGGENLTPSPSPKGDDKPWAERNWWVILLICIGAVLIIGIVVAILVVSLSSSGSSGSGKANKKEIEKSEKIMDTVVPIEKIKQENEISDDDIYKPFSYEVIMEGYLLKEGHDRVIGKWQRRYCVLYFEPSVLRIYDSMVPSYYGKVYIDEKQSIPLDCYSGIEYKEGSNEFTLVLKVRDSTIKSFEAGDKERKIHLKVEGENGIETAKRWVECFRDFKNQKPKSGDAWTRPLIVDQQNGKISTSTSKAAEKKNEDIVLKAQQRRQAHTAANVN